MKIGQGKIIENQSCIKQNSVSQLISLKNETW